MIDIISLVGRSLLVFAKSEIARAQGVGTRDCPHSVIIGLGGEEEEPQDGFFEGKVHTCFIAS